MPLQRNPNNVAVEMAVGLASQFLAFMKEQYPERLGEGPLPERQRRIGILPADPIIESVVSLVPGEEVR